MWSILSANETYNYALAKWLDEKLKPLPTNEYIISDVFQFAQDIQHFKLGENDTLVSYDVTALFTNVPLDETINILADKALKDKNAFICSTEEKLARENKLPSLYRRYVDDTLALVRDLSEATDLLTCLIEAYPSFQFTMEIATNDRLRFIAIEIIKVDDDEPWNPRLQKENK